MKVLFDAAFIITVVMLIVINFRTMLLPNRITLPGFIISVIVHTLTVRTEAGVLEFFQRWVSSPAAASLLDSLAGALIALGSLWLLNRIWGKARGGRLLGGGDMKMMAMVGAYLGIPGAVDVVLVSTMLVLGFMLLTSARRRNELVLPSGIFWGLPAIFFTLVSAVRIVHLLWPA